MLTNSLFIVFAAFLAIVHVGLCEKQLNKTTLCTCAQAAKCADDGFKQVENGCKMECADLLSTFVVAKDDAKDAPLPLPLTHCFARNVKMEAMPMTECMRKRVNNYCASSSTARTTAPVPDYAGWMEFIAPTNDTDFEKKHKSAFLRKSRTAFIIFRNFQKCMNNCAKERSKQCFDAEGCAISLPSDRAKAKLFYNQCTQQQNVPKNARDACQCLISKHKVRQLVGVCPLFMNKHLMQKS